MKEIIIDGVKLQFVIGDITAQDTEAVVNAANSQLAPGGGVAGAIHAAAGPGLWQECAKLGGCPTGAARISGGHKLPNRYVIHTVGPVYSGSARDPELLASCYLESLKLADANGVRSIAFPALSTGIFGYPVREAAMVAIRAFCDYLRGDTAIETLRMVLYDQRSYEQHCAALEEILNG